MQKPIKVHGRDSQPYVETSEDGARHGDATPQSGDADADVAQARIFDEKSALSNTNEGHLMPVKDESSNPANQHARFDWKAFLVGFVLAIPFGVLALLSCCFVFRKGEKRQKSAFAGGLIVGIIANIALIAILYFKLRKQSPDDPAFFSARCIALSDSCTLSLADRSAGCVAGTKAQSLDCVAAACSWCGYPDQKGSGLCQSGPIKTHCASSAAFGAPTTSQASTTAMPATTAAMATAPPTTTPALDAPGTWDEAGTPGAPGSPETNPAPLPSPSRPNPTDAGGYGAVRAAGACTWEGADSVVINLGEVEAANGWERTTRSGFTGLIFRPTWGAGLSPPGQGGAMCFPVRVTQPGDYFWTFVSYAPHVTEHNDAWVSSLDRPVKLWKILGYRTIVEPPGKYLKAFQGNGAERGISTEMKTVDNDGHRFTVLDVEKDVPFRVCLSGRSFRFSVFRLVLQKCFGNICRGGSLGRDFVYKMPVSKCV